MALIGFALSLIVHLSTYAGINPQKKFPPIWLLHIGIFVVFIPALLARNRLNNGRNKSSIPNLFDNSIPKWMKILCKIFCYYVFINFVCFMILMKDGSPNIISGNYVISDHGKIVRVISEQEYELYQSYVVRGFSGHWMIFYISAAGLSLQCQRNRDKETR